MAQIGDINKILENSIKKVEELNKDENYMALNKKIDSLKIKMDTIVNEIFEHRHNVVKVNALENVKKMLDTELKRAENDLKEMEEAFIRLNAHLGVFEMMSH